MKDPIPPARALLAESRAAISSRGHTQKCSEALRANRFPFLTESVPDCQRRKLRVQDIANPASMDYLADTLTEEGEYGELFSNQLIATQL
jgi:hypothetical protein